MVLCCCQAADASAYVGGTGTLTFVGTPTVVALGPLQAAEVTLDNHLGVSVLGIAIMVIHNALGQTIYYSTATLNLTRGSYATAYIVEAGVPTGVYNATIFAFSTGGGGSLELDDDRFLGSIADCSKRARVCLPGGWVP